MASTRRYLTSTELATYANISITDSTEADQLISDAERFIDYYAGYVQRFLTSEVRGVVASGTTTTITLQSKHQNQVDDDYYKYCHVDIVAGTGAGQTTAITASTRSGVLTVDTLDTAPDSTSIYRIYQLGAFPRKADTMHNTENSVYVWGKWIPQEVKQATAAQAAYMIENREAFYSSDTADKQSESIDGYSYSVSVPYSHRLVAPRARAFMKGIVVRVGKFA